jgi:hypothetical protein
MGMDPLHIGGNYSSRRPLLGFYDLLDQNIIDSQIKEAASRGLSYFAFYWYWDTHKNTEANVSAALVRFTTSPYKSLMKFLIAPIPVSGTPMTLEMWDEDVVPYMVTRYITDPSYLRTTDGRPVIVDFGWWQNDTAHAAGLSYLRSATVVATGNNPLILFVAQEVHTTADLAYAQSHLGLDGFTCFTFGPAYPGEPYVHTLSQIVPTLERQNMSFYVPCATTGEDTRIWWRVGYGFGIQPEQMLYNTNITFSAFQQNLEELKNYIGGNVSRTSKMLTIYAWNEWGEGGHVEPDAIYGYKYLDIIQSVFGLTARTDQPTFGPDNLVMVDWHAPSSMTAGASATAGITVLNTGSTAWTTADGYKLGSQNPQNNTVWGLDRVLLSSSQNVAPGTRIVFSFTIRAPSQPGVYNFRWRMVHEDVAWFGDSTPTARITVAPGSTSTTSTYTTSSLTALSTSSTVKSTSPSLSTSVAATVLTSSSGATSSTTTGGQGIPEFPFQLVVVSVLVLVIALSYFVIRGWTFQPRPKDSMNQCQRR